MLNPFRPLEVIWADEFTTLPEEFREKRRTPWSDANRHGESVDSFLEGPSFDRQGNLLVVDIPFGRIFRVDASGRWELIVQYDGWPNGLKLHKDGRAFIADYRRGIMVLDMATHTIEPYLETFCSEGFKGVNDLHFAPSGDLYFTDQGQSGIADATGRVFCLRADGTLHKLVTNAPSPNGLSFNRATNQLYVAVTRGQQVWRLPLMTDGQPAKVGVAIQLSGGVGPDGIEFDGEGGLIVCHLGVGVWRFDANGLPTHLIVGPEGSILTNSAFGGDDGKTLFITDSRRGRILTARLPVAGATMYGRA